MQQAVTDLVNLGQQLTDDLDDQQLSTATSYIDALIHPLSDDDIEALMQLLPKDGDTASGINWSILHALEAAPSWPRWDLLRDQSNEWVDILRHRLANSGYVAPTE